MRVGGACVRASCTSTQEEGHAQLQDPSRARNPFPHQSFLLTIPHARRSMPEFADKSFDGVLDKGTLDAILCGEGSAVHAAAMVMEAFRVLKPCGVLMLVTYGDPLSRLPYLNKIPDWDVSVLALTKQVGRGSFGVKGGGDTGWRTAHHTVLATT